MNILLWIILGLIAGWLASVLMRTNSQQGMVADMVIGIIGAVVGGFLMTMLGAAGVTGFNMYSLFVATLGAVVLIAVRRAVT